MGATCSGNIRDQSNDPEDHKNAAEDLAEVSNAYRDCMWFSPRHSNTEIFGLLQIALL